MATTWGTGTTVPTQTSLEDTSRKVTCTDKYPAKCDASHIALTAGNSATRIVDMWHNNTGSTYGSIRLTIHRNSTSTVPTISTASSGVYWSSNDFGVDNADIYNFTDKTYSGYISLSGSTAQHKVFALHKAERPSDAAYLFIGYSGSRSNTTSISAEYRRTFTVGYNAWNQYKQNKDVLDGLNTAHDYFSITLNEYNKFVPRTYRVYKGIFYTINLHTFSEDNCDGIIISKVSLTDNTFSTLRNNANTIAYSSGYHDKKTVTYKPTEDGYIYIYFKTDGSIFAGKDRYQIGSTTTTVTTTTTWTGPYSSNSNFNHNPHIEPKYEYTDLYTYGDVDITCNQVYVQISLNHCGGTNGDSYVSYQPGGQGVPDSTIPSMSDQEDIMDVAVPTKYVNGSSGTAYTFLGYYTTKIGGEQYIDNTGNCVHDIDFIQSTTLYAHWGNTITNTGTWYTKEVYCTDLPRKASSAIGNRTVNIRPNGGSCIHNPGNITFTLDNPPSGFTMINAGVLTIASGKSSGTYSLNVIMTSPGQDGSTPGGYLDDGGNYYFPMTYVKRYLYVRLLPVRASGFGPIGIEEYSYDGQTSLYTPIQVVTIPATSVSFNIASGWNNYLSIPDVYQDTQYNNNAIGYRLISDYIYNATYNGNTYLYEEYGPHNFSNLGTTVLNNGRVTLTHPQRRTYVTPEIKNGILSWIQDNAQNQAMPSSYSSIEVNPTDRLASYNLGVEPEVTTTTTKSYTTTTTTMGMTNRQTLGSNINQNYNPPAELIEYICNSFAGTDYYSDLKTALYDNWLSFDTIYDLIVYVQNNTPSSHSMHAGDYYSAFVMERKTMVRNQNIPTLQITAPSSNVTLNLRSPGNTTTLTVKATYPSGSVENDVTASCTITSSPTGKVTIS